MSNHQPKAKPKPKLPGQAPRVRVQPTPRPVRRGASHPSSSATATATATSTSRAASSTSQSESESQSRSVSPKKAWWLPSTSELEDLQAQEQQQQQQQQQEQQQQKERQSQILQPDLSLVLLDALGGDENVQQVTVEVTPPQVIPVTQVTPQVTPVTQAQTINDNNQTELLQQQQPSIKVKRVVRRAKSLMDPVQAQKQIHVLPQNSNHSSSHSATPITHTSSNSNTNTSANSELDPTNSWQNSKRKMAAIPTSQQPQPSATTDATTQTLPHPRHSSTTSTSSHDHQHQHQNHHPHQHHHRQYHQPPKRSLSLGQPNNSISTKQIEAFIEQEKKAKHVFTADWGVGDADDFVKQLQHQGELDIRQIVALPTTTSSTKVKVLSPQKLSWKELESKMQQSALKRAHNFRAMPHLQQAAYTLVLSQLLTPQEREQLYHVYCQINATDQQQAQQGYAQVFGGTRTRTSTSTSNDNDNHSTFTAGKLDNTPHTTNTTKQNDSEVVVMDYSEFMVGAALASYHHEEQARSENKGKRRLDNLSGESLRKAFAMFDNEGKGFITKDNLIHLCTHQDATTQRIIDLVLNSSNNNNNDSDTTNSNKNNVSDDGSHNLSFADFVSLFFGDDDDDDDDEQAKNPSSDTKTSTYYNATATTATIATATDSSTTRTTATTKAKKDKSKKKSSKKSKKKDKNKSKKKKSKKKKSKDKDKNGSSKTTLNTSHEFDMDFDDLSIDETIDSFDDDDGDTLGDDISIDTMSDESTSSGGGSCDGDNDDRYDSNENIDNDNGATSIMGKNKKPANAGVFDWKSHSKTRESLKVQSIMANKKAKDNRQRNKSTTMTDASKPVGEAPSSQSPHGDVSFPTSLPQTSPKQSSQQGFHISDGALPTGSIALIDEIGSPKTQKPALPADSLVASPIEETALKVDTSDTCLPAVKHAGTTSTPPDPATVIAHPLTVTPSPVSTTTTTTATTLARIATQPTKAPPLSPSHVDASSGVPSPHAVATMPITQKTETGSKSKSKSQIPTPVTPATDPVAATPSDKTPMASIIATHAETTIAAPKSAPPTLLSCPEAGSSKAAATAFVSVSSNDAPSAPKQHFPGNAPRRKVSVTPAPSTSKPHIPANTPRGGGSGIGIGSIGSGDSLSGGDRKAWPPVKTTPTTVPAETSARVDPGDKRDRDESLAAAKRKALPPSVAAAGGPKLSKAFLWELKTNQKDLSRKLKPVVRKKTERRKVFDPDQPYMEELKEVQAEVLPVWRRETYSYWI